MTRRTLPVYSETVALDVCRDCGGECCKQGPGTCAPEDFGTEEGRQVRMEEALRSGQYVPEGFEPPLCLKTGEKIDAPAWMHFVVALRPATKRTGSCVFWQRGKGCTIFETRPTGCRTLVPAEHDIFSALVGDRCVQPAADGAALWLSWVKHQDVVLAAVKATGARVRSTEW